MKPRLVLDTNVILDLLVFKDPSTEPIRLMLDAKIVDAVRSEASMLELVDVIQRPIFKLSREEQDSILQAWASVTQLLENTAIESAPLICRDLDDQIFLDMAYSIRPAVLFSKDLRLLELRVSAKGHGVEITNQYDYLQAPSP
jgi:putative PIN family toxin of toxin-antitoxin system